MLKTRLLPCLLLAFFITAMSPAAAAQPRVVTSIKPLELLVRAVATENTRVTSLVPAGASPHNYNIRPSQRQALQEADVIFWVGPAMESFLERLLDAGEFRRRSTALMSEDHNGPAGTTAAGTAHGHGEHDHGDGEDPHVWLDPMLALAMAGEIHAKLAALPGADTQQLDTNLAAFRQALTRAEQSIRERLEAAAGISLFTYHNAFSRFAEHYGLAVAGVLTLNPELSPGARHMAQVQQKLQQAANPCLLTEPQFNRQGWRAITRDLEVTFSTWDPLASEIPADRNGYVAFQLGLADAVLACLPENAQ